MPKPHLDDDLNEYWFKFHQLLNYLNRYGDDITKNDNYRELKKEMLELRRNFFYQESFKNEEVKNRDLVLKMVKEIRGRFTSVDPEKPVNIEEIAGPLYKGNDVWCFYHDEVGIIQAIVSDTKKLESLVVKEIFRRTKTKEYSNMDTMRFKIIVESPEAKKWRRQLPLSVLSVEDQYNTIMQKIPWQTKTDKTANKHICDIIELLDRGKLRKGKKKLPSKRSKKEVLEYVNRKLTSGDFKIPIEIKKKISDAVLWYTQYSLLNKTMRHKYREQFQAIHEILEANLCDELLFDTKWDIVPRSALSYVHSDEAKLEVEEVKLEEELRIKSTVVTDKFNDLGLQVDYMLFNSDKKSALFVEHLLKKKKNVDEEYMKIKNKGEIDMYKYTQNGNQIYVVHSDNMVLHFSGKKSTEQKLLVQEIVRKAVTKYHECKFQQSLEKIIGHNMNTNISSDINKTKQIEELQNDTINDAIISYGELDPKYLIMIHTMNKNVLARYPDLLRKHPDVSKRRRTMCKVFTGKNDKTGTDIKGTNIKVTYGGEIVFEIQVRDPEENKICLDSEQNYHDKSIKESSREIDQNHLRAGKIFFFEDNYSNGLFLEDYVDFYEKLMNSKSEQICSISVNNVYGHIDDIYNHASNLIGFMKQNNLDDWFESVQKSIQNIPRDFAQCFGAIYCDSVGQVNQEYSTKLESLLNYMHKKKDVGADIKLPKKKDIEDTMKETFITRSLELMSRARDFIGNNLGVEDMELKEHVGKERGALILMANYILNYKEILGIPKNSTEYRVLEGLFNIAGEKIVKHISAHWQPTERRSLNTSYVPVNTKKNTTKLIKSEDKIKNYLLQKGLAPDYIDLLFRKKVYSVESPGLRDKRLKNILK